MIHSARAFLHRFREPIAPDTVEAMRRNRERVPESLRVPQQLLGRSTNGCGATIGAMPRCDFACVGCYLGADANHIPPEPVEAIKEQMRRLKPQLGRPGNLQLTDGEITLRPVEEVIELLRYAHGIGLLPMLMTHGDSFRRRPGLLERLMTEGGLREVSIHIDTTQRGRKGYKQPPREDDLHPLRDEFVELIRKAKRDTGLPLHAATTMTVTSGNLAGVAGVMEWLLRNSDVFSVVSFQPVAQVGRTVDGLGGGVAVEALWDEIRRGIGDGATRVEVDAGTLYVGHPACNRYLSGVVVNEEGRAPRYLPTRQVGDALDDRVVGGFLERFGGVSLRDKRGAESLGVVAGLVRRDVGFFLRNTVPYVWAWLHRLGGGRPIRFLARERRGEVRLSNLTVISHHFMSRAELETPLGQERIATCVFHVPIGDRLVPMCEVNATDLRDRYYADIAGGRAPGREIPVLYPLRVAGKPVETHAS
jgi:MoaA/NifB/PqqE/SkfB family radical SAM enzyme